MTGGIAAYKSAELTRLLIKSGIEVQVVMTEAGTRFVTPTTLQALSGNTVFTDAWDPRIANNMAHIELSRNADAILIAPATADFLAKLAHGLADDLLSTLCVARQPTSKLLVAPAMNREMWENAATQRNVSQLRGDGVTILGPDSGDQACGESGMGRMQEPELLLAAIESLFKKGALMGLRALVTAGPTFEPIDPVRGITNSSSGKMGYAIAQALTDSGADVVLVSGPTALRVPDGVRSISIQTASQMFDAVKGELDGVDLFFAVAAVSDYTPAQPQTQKIKKASSNLSVELAPTTDILAWVAGQPKPLFCVGFAAESENVVEYARKKRENKKIPMIVANLATSAIGADDNEITIIDEAGDHHFPRASKAAIAKNIVNHATQLYLKLLKKQPSALKSVKNA
ncbi:MAG: bifunctional phosphopantothenoylcysteine decarboxylase/phosphopantothenate--cysteine ligase CoaBC [Betaproteobacteria bacterium]